VQPDNPASFQCAFGSGDSCRLCPSGAMCPGGSRLWPRIGYWAAHDTDGAVAACAPPAATRCTGWDVTSGATQCGTGYLKNGYFCSACAKGFYLQDDATCVLCPVLVSLWDRYSSLLCIFVVIAAAVAVVWLGLLVLVRLRGGTLVGGARRMLQLGVWGLMTAQVVSNAATVSSTTLPPLLASLYRAIAVLQLHGVLLPPACTGAYPFETQVEIICAALGAWFLAVAVYYSRAGCCVRFQSGVQQGNRSLENSVLSSKRALLELVGRGALVLAIVLYPNVSGTAVELLDCEFVTMVASAAAALDGGPSVPREFGVATTRSAKATVQVLSSNPYYVCWAGSHRTAGALAVAALVCYVFCMPLVTLWWVWRDPRQRRLRLRLSSTSAVGFGSTSASTSAVSIEVAPGKHVCCGCKGGGSTRAPRRMRPRSRHASVVTRTQASAIVDVGMPVDNDTSPLAPKPDIRNPLHSQTTDDMAVGATESVAALRAILATPTAADSADKAEAGAVTEAVRRIRRQQLLPLPPAPGDPFLNPFMEDYSPHGWHTKHIDLALLLLLSLLRVLLNRPTTLGAVVAKAAVACFFLLLVCAHVIVVRPFLAGQSWKGWVRVMLLVDSAGCVLLNAAAAAADLSAAANTGSPSPSRTSIYAGSVVLFAACVLTLIVLLVGFVVSAYQGEAAALRVLHFFEHGLRAEDRACGILVKLFSIRSCKCVSLFCRR
jgi:hypothetical protein